jgi:serine protease
VGRVRLCLLAGALIGCLSFAAAAAANPILMPTTSKRLQQEAAIHTADQSLTPPAPPCPESGFLPSPFSNCGLPETPATSLPFMGNMAYWGGPVQVHPKDYLVFWGWGEHGAFPGQTCAPENLTEGSITATLACDPDGAGKYMADFVQQMGGTAWANVSTQYYQTDSSGNRQFVSNDPDVLAGIWADDTNDITRMPSTSATAPAGSGNTYYDLAAEAQRAIAHFGITDLNDSNIIIAQPPAYSDPNAINQGYCAFHDWTDTRIPGNSYYKGPDITQAFAYTNMPYALAINSGGVNVCGENAVNTDARGKLDGFSIVLGHEIEEAITDPGAEDVVSSGPTGTQTYEGGWYDPLDANENGDKCAWVGENLFTAQGPPEPIYGALGNMTGNAGERFAVQSLWSNAADEGTGYCAGAGTDSPLPSAP